MNRLSTLLYASVLFTLCSTACAPRRAARVAVRLTPPSARLAEPVRPKTASPPNFDQPSDRTLASLIDAHKEALRTAYAMDIDYDLKRKFTSYWDPHDKSTEIRGKIMVHLNEMVELYRQRIARDPSNPALQMGFHRVNFILQEFRREDARAAGR